MLLIIFVLLRVMEKDESKAIFSHTVLIGRRCHVLHYASLERKKYQNSGIQKDRRKLHIESQVFIYPCHVHFCGRDLLRLRSFTLVKKIGHCRGGPERLGL